MKSRRNHRAVRSACVAIGVVALAACGPVQTTTDGSSADSSPRPAPLNPASLAEADLERGELLSLACQACHTITPGGEHNIGPNLYGVFGREAASLEDFAYSDGLRGAGIVWTPEALDGWLLDPAGYVPGSSMAFFGYREADDRRDLIAYLLATLDEPGRGR